jgi:hypothetical protein
MTEQPPRPVALTVLPDNIPAELKALPIWSCWLYEWNQKKSGGGKWDKVPYTPFTLKNAMSNKPSTWRSFAAAYNCYIENRQGFDGIFICLQADDPYAGGDFDHSTDLSRVPDTYAEYSPSGEGIRFIGRGTIPSACKKPSGELYAWRRFLSITGHKLPSAPCDIRPIQPALDKLYEELKGVSPQDIKEGKSTSGSRAEKAALISAEMWQAGRDARRNGFNRLLARLRASAVSRKTKRDDTQLGYLLREDYRTFHERWPAAGIVRADGSIDSSQIRACMASNIRSRGFTFPEFAALMSFFFGTEMASKWGTGPGVREEIAALWFMGRTPRADEYKPGTPEPTKRGRGSDHAALVERAYQVILEYRVGINAIIKVNELADALRVDRRTAFALLAELNGKKGGARRITSRKFGADEGLIIDFEEVIKKPIQNQEVINGANTNGATPHHNGTNGHNPHDAITATKIETPGHQEVIISHEEDVMFSAPESHKHAVAQTCDNRDDAPYIYIYTRSISNCVYTPPLITSQNSILNRVDAPPPAVPTLQALADHYLSLPATAIGRRIVNERIGTVMYRRDVKHFAELVTAEYPYSYDAATEAYRTEQARRAQLATQEWERFFRRLKAMTNDELIAYISGRLRSEVAELAREGATFDKHLYQTRMRVAKQHLTWRGLAIPARRTRLRPHQPRAQPPPIPKPSVEQHQLLEAVSQPGAATGLIERLKQARKRGDE